MPKAKKNVAFGTAGKHLKNDGLWEEVFFVFLWNLNSVYDILCFDVYLNNINFIPFLGAKSDYN